MIIVLERSNKTFTDIDLMLSFIIFVNDILNRCLCNKQIGILSEQIGILSKGASINFRNVLREESDII